MPLSPGHRIGNYEVLGPAGAGGMGEVYRARDSRLDRIVAIKALPPGVAGDTARLARFEREAKVLASLNHPNIAAIYGIEDASGGPYLILEFVEGETLEQRLASGPLPIMDAVRIGARIAAAVEAAHEKNVVHRDLKPANIMITGTDSVKVLDFGLAKDAAQPGDPDPELPSSPTMPFPITEQGMVLGTTPYMSPEQARGKPLDRRVDVWAFGCILMECLTARKVFRGETASDVIATILQLEPAWDQLPPATPPRLLDILRRCLTKDVNLRPRDLGDIGRELQMLLSDSTSGATRVPADVPSLAVLYFVNLARDPDSEYFCTGITEDILSDLSKIKGLRVASKNAVSRYQGTKIDLGRIAADLGVTAVLEGSVRRAGDRIRITTQLINVSDGFQLWAERFDRTLDDVFAVQDEIATAIVEALRVTMTPSDIKEIARDRPADARAYDLYLKGREKYRLYSKEAMQEAMDLFREAIALEPDYALAWAGVADCHAQFLQYSWTEDREASTRLGLEAARKAIAIDPNLPEAHKAEANVLVVSGGSREEVLRSLGRAIEADPDFVPALLNLGVLYFIDGNLAGGERLARRALEIDPREPHAFLWLSHILNWTNRSEECLIVTRRLREVSNSDFYLTTAYHNEIIAHCLLGNFGAAEELLSTGRRDDRIDSANLLIAAVYLEAYRGRIKETKEHLEQALLQPLHELLFATRLVEAASRVGEPELGLAILNKSLSPTARKYLPIALRLEHGCHFLLDRDEFGPRKASMTLIWPLQAPMIDEARYALFEEVRIKSARPDGTGVLEKV